MSVATTTVLDKVFPAHAGMSPVNMQIVATINRFPRSRGDEPDLLPNTVWPYAFSPLTRG